MRSMCEVDYYRIKITLKSFSDGDYIKKDYQSIRTVLKHLYTMHFDYYTNDRFSPVQENIR